MLACLLPPATRWGSLTWLPSLSSCLCVQRSCLPDVPARAGLAAGWGWTETAHHPAAPYLLPLTETSLAQSLPQELSIMGGVQIYSKLGNECNLGQIDALAG